MLARANCPTFGSRAVEFTPYRKPQEQKPLEPPTRAKTDIKPQLLAEGLGVIFFALVVIVANGLQLFYILFPELGALASDVLVRPGGKWAKEPWKLIVTPTATGAIGILVGTYSPYGVGTLLLAMSLSIAVVRGMRSAVAPAISAGVLPIVLGVTSWLYVLGVFGSLSVLAGLLLLWRRTTSGRSLAPVRAPDDKAVDVLETAPRGRVWFPALLVFVASLGVVAQVTTWRFILFPPLIVMAYEMFGHPDTCPWAKQAVTFPVVCSFAALAGVGAVQWLGVNPVATSFSLIFTLPCCG